MNFGLKYPEEVLLVGEVDYFKLSVFECLVYSHIPSDKRSKNDPKVHRRIFLSFGREVKGFKL